MSVLLRIAVLSIALGGAAAATPCSAGTSLKCPNAVDDGTAYCVPCVNGTYSNATLNGCFQQCTACTTTDQHSVGNGVTGGKVFFDACGLPGQIQSTPPPSPSPCKECPSCMCYLGATIVTTPRGPKSIDKLAVGDEVCARLLHIHQQGLGTYVPCCWVFNLHLVESMIAGAGCTSKWCFGV